MALGSRSPAFTFTETLVTVALMVLFVGLLAGLVFQGSTVAHRLDAQGGIVADKVSWAIRLPVLCQEVQPPEWARSENTFVEVSGGITARYYHSDPNQTLTVTIANNHLVAKTPQGSWSWSALSPFKVSFWKQNGRIIGLVAQWTEGGLQRSSYLPWGGRPL